MKYLFLLLFLLLSLPLASQTMRDSSYTVDSTATACQVTISLTAKQAAMLYRIFGATWQEECRSTIVATARARDPYAEYKEQYDAIMGSTLTAQQKQVAIAALGIPDPKLLKVTRLVAVPKLAP